MKFKWVAMLLSLLGAGHLFFYTYYDHSGFKQGLDFSGGLKLEVTANDVVTLDSLRSLFKKEKITATTFLVRGGKGKIIKIEIDVLQDSVFEKEAEKSSEKLTQAGFSVNSVDYLQFLLIQKLTPRYPSNIKVLNADKIGPTVGDLLRKSSIKLLLITLLLITLYVAFRFQFSFAIGAMIALAHDLILTAGFIGYLQIPLSVPVVAALLTILGYSINDTIVIFDRIRENLKNTETTLETHRGFSKVIDKSISESISRTVVTGITTLIAVGSLYIYGGENLKGMALVLVLGIIIGTYSSSFTASPIVLMFEKILKK